MSVRRRRVKEWCLCVLVCVLSFAMVWSCTPPVEPPPDPPDPPKGPVSRRDTTKDYSRKQMTNNEVCEVEIAFPGDKAPPLNEVFAMQIKVRKVDGSPLEKVSIQIAPNINDPSSTAYMATMPDHGHGMDVNPSLVALDKGSFKVDGMLFHMMGWWMVHLRLPEGCGVGKDGAEVKAEFNVFTEPTLVDLRGMATETAVKFTSDEFSVLLGLSPLPAPPANPTNKYADDPKAAHLGQFLFYEAGFSKTPDGKAGASCATCHDPKQGWSDGKALSKGVAQLGRHSPTLWNVAYNRWFFWDGRADSAWSQALKPIEDAKEMNSDRVTLLLYFKKNAALAKAYEEVFGKALPATDKLPPEGAKPVPCSPDLEGQEDKQKAIPCGKFNPAHVRWEALDKETQDTVNRFFSNVGKAIEAFERKIISRDSKFDRFVDGIRNNKPDQLTNLSESAQRGLKLFIARDGCVTCHSGPNFTNNEFHNVGLLIAEKTLGADLKYDGRRAGMKILLGDIFNGIGPWSSDSDKLAPHNQKIRFMSDKNNHAFQQFKTPTLRSVATSKPYMHDGRFKELSDVVKFYSHFGVKDPSKCLKDGRAITDIVKGSLVKSQPKECILPPTFGDREEFMRLLLLKDEQIEDIVAFLESLTGQNTLSEALLSQPKSPSL